METKIQKKEEDVCSFCGKNASQAGTLIASSLTKVFICDHCIKISQGLAEDVINGKNREMLETIPVPAEIKNVLDQYVIGQELPKKILAVALYNNYLRQVKKSNGDCTRIDKSNILLVGPTGSGKTLLAKTLANNLKVPFYEADATTLTETGYVGEDVTNIILGLLRAASHKVSDAERGIIVIDEIDKIATNFESFGRDISGEGVQQDLLKILEGKNVNLILKSGSTTTEYNIDTTNILFIGEGTFSGIREMKQKSRSNHVGFISTENEYQERITQEDLRNFGLLPEFIGRFPIIAELDKLTENNLMDILIYSEGSLIKQYQALFALQDVNLYFKTGALREIVQQALKLKTGARGLKTVMENFMLDINFSLPSNPDIKGCVITREVVRGIGEPEIKRIKTAIAAKN